VAEQVGVGVAIHLPYEHLGAVDVTFGGSRVSGKGEPGGDCVLVAAQADLGVHTTTRTVEDVTIDSTFFTVFREIRSRRPIARIAIPSARCSRRISVQSSPFSTPRSSGAGQHSPEPEGRFYVLSTAAAVLSSSR
jgi:hypothetical protein